MLRNTVEIFGIPVDNVTMSGAIESFKSFLDGDSVHSIYTPNAEIIMEAQRDPELRKVLCEAGLLVADGAGVVLASKILGKPVYEKVSGIDLVKNSFSIESPKKLRYFLFGGKPGIAEEAAKKILEQFPLLEIAGCRNGYFKSEDEEEIINEINSSNAHILLVALGAPKQEKWIHRNKGKLNVKICMGVGGTLDVLSGQVKLAPEFMRKAGLEWLYRLYKEPWRYKRMLDLPRFVLLAFKTRILGRTL